MRGEVWMDIRSDRQKGLSYVKLGKKYHMDQRTARRYAESPSKPEYTLTGPKPTKLDPYKQKIDQMPEEAPYSAVRILEKLQAEGAEVLSRERIVRRTKIRPRVVRRKVLFFYGVG